MAVGRLAVRRAPARVRRARSRHRSAVAVVPRAAAEALDAARAVAETADAGAAAAALGASAFEQALGKAAFGSLFVSTGLYWGKAAFTDTTETGKPEEYATGLANAAITTLLVERWVDTGHFPLSNMYESLFFLAWCLTAVQLGVTYKMSRSNVTGVLSAPVALAVVAGAALALPPELQKAGALVPALKSNWLLMHVSVMMLSYATLMSGSLTAGTYLLIDATKDWDFLPDLSKLMPGGEEEAGEAGAGAAGEAAAAAAEAQEGGAVATTLLAQVAPPKLSKAEQLLETCDDLAYRCLGLGFVLLTVGIISGAVWANEAWGSYWSWDPKETWALICWLVYATYLHTRITVGWEAKDTAKVAVGGFAAVWICYVGVNLWGVGLHSYGFFGK